MVKYDWTKLMTFNRDETGLDRYADLALREPIGGTPRGVVGVNEPQNVAPALMSTSAQDKVSFGKDIP